MTFLEVLQSHRGGLLHIKSELYWYDGGLRVGTRGRVCLILDAAALDAAFHTADAFGEFAATTVSSARPTAAAAALLLIDGCPKWIWVGQEDVEIL